MVNFDSVMVNFSIIFAIGCILVIIGEILLYTKVKNGIINKLGLQILLFDFFCSMATSFCTIAMMIDQTTFYWSLIIVLPVALVIFIVLAYYLYIAIYRPIIKLMLATESFSEGNLSTNINVVKRSDELGKLENSFSKMNLNFSGIVSQINNATKLLASTTEQLATSSEEVNASGEEISAITQRISSGAQDQSTKLSELTVLSNKFKNEFERKIEDINQTSSLIENLSSQVNMLSLNASIEAARAGEYGRGFSVVADNIRRLADESKISVNKVQDTIEKMHQDLSKNITLLIDTVDAIAIVAQDTASNSEEASASTEEQSATMEEISASAQELAELARNLEQTISHFKL